MSFYLSYGSLLFFFNTPALWGTQEIYTADRCFQVVASGKINRVQQMLDKADLPFNQVRDAGNNTLLHAAAKGESTEILSLLSDSFDEKKAVVDFLNDQEETPFHAAARVGALRNIRLLCKKKGGLGIDINQTNRSGEHFFFLLVDNLIASPHNKHRQACCDLITELCCEGDQLGLDIHENDSGATLLTRLLDSLDTPLESRKRTLLIQLFKSICRHANKINLDLNQRLGYFRKTILEAVTCRNIPDLFVYLCANAESFGIPLESDRYYTVLDLAAHKTDPFYLKYLCANAHQLRLDLNKKNVFSNKPLLLETACYAHKNGMASILFLCENAHHLKVDLNATTDQGDNLFHLAVRHSNKELVDYLYQNHARLGLRLNSNQKNKYGKSCLADVVDYGSYDMLIYLLEQIDQFKWDLKDFYEGEDILRYCIVQKKIGLVRYLCKHRDQLGIELHVRNKWGEDGFQAAALSKDKNILSIFERIDRHKMLSNRLYQRGWLRYLIYKLYQEIYHIIFLKLLLFSLIYRYHRQLLEKYVLNEFNRTQRPFDRAWMRRFFAFNQPHCFWQSIYRTTLSTILSLCSIYLVYVGCNRPVFFDKYYSEKSGFIDLLMHLSGFLGVGTYIIAHTTPYFLLQRVKSFEAFHTMYPAL